MNEYKLIVTNFYGESVDLWGDREVALTSLEGVSLEADVNTMNLSGIDGSSFVSSRLPERNISMIIQYRDDVIDAEKTKLRMYRIFQPKEKITIRYVSPNQDKYIEGYVTKCDTPPTAFPMVSQITIKAPDPYWRTLDDHRTLLCGVTNGFEFIKDATEFDHVEFGMIKTSQFTSVNYDGNTATGIKVMFEVLYPITMIGLKNVNTGESIKVEDDFQVGDIITICTIPKHKEITLLRSAQTIDRLVKMTPDSRFISIYPGENTLEVMVRDGSIMSVNVICHYETLFGGI